MYGKEPISSDWAKSFDEALRHFSRRGRESRSRPAHALVLQGFSCRILSPWEELTILPRKSFEKGSQVQVERKESVHDILLQFVRLQEKPLRDTLEGFIDRAENRGS